MNSQPIGLLVKDGHRLKSTPIIQFVHHTFREGSPFLDADRPLTLDLAYGGALLATQTFAPLLTRL